jgi:hypothetical protein
MEVERKKTYDEVLKLREEVMNQKEKANESEWE